MDAPLQQIHGIPERWDPTELLGFQKALCIGRVIKECELVGYKWFIGWFIKPSDVRWLINPMNII